MAPLSLHGTLNPLIETCYTKDCIQAASDLFQSMDMNIDPCSDFYQYVCAGWIEATVIPEEMEVFGIMEAQEKQQKEKIKSIIEGTYSDLLKSTVSTHNFLLDIKENKQIDKKNFQLVQDYYNSCNDIDISDGDERLKAFFQEYRDLKLQALHQTENDLPLVINQQVMDIIAYPKSNDDIIIEAGGLYSIEIAYDEEDRSKMSLIIYPPLEFDDRETIPLKDYNEEDLVELISSLFSFKNPTERDTKRLEMLEDFRISTLNGDDIQSLIDNAIMVQEKLFQMSLDEDNQLYSTYTLNELSKNFPFTDWERIILRDNLEYGIISDVTINVFNERYFQYLNYYMTVSDSSRILNKQSILDFITVHKILNVAQSLDKQIRNLVNDSPFQTRSSICMDKVVENLGHAIGRIHSMIAFSEKDRLQLQKISETIESSLSRLIETSEWLDEATRLSAINKLNSMKKVIGYSTDSPDIRSPKEVQSYLSGLDISDNFYTNEMSIRKWTLEKYWSTLGRVIDFPEWIGIPGSQQLVAMNLLSKNSIFVSAAYAQKPYFSKNYPDYLNYAGIGQTIAHEYSHSFDSTGSDFDENGVVRNWWSKLAKARYLDKSQCFIEQYSEEFIIDENKKERHIDGLATLGENIADNLGLSASYYAYKELKESSKGYNPILPGFQDFSADALFFLSAGRSFCSKARPNMVESMLQDEHSPESIRANKIFQNNGDFARAFNCPVGSKMNPSRKCKVW